ncbi:MAG: CBS domain-containing protein [Candidatus Bathyarchaeota archaeon]|nr:MAG: CBS domain-containing protein [Candidatus Bathyarchaeota archaeon]
MDLDFKRKLIVREAMSSPVITVNEDQSVVEAAKTMSDQRIGSIIVRSGDGQPVGIVTERDLVYRVIAKDTVPREVKVKEVMSSPLRTVDPETSLEDAMAMMGSMNVRRLGVIYKGSLEGVISDKDILRIMPTIIEIVREQSRIQSGSRLSGPSIVGYCDRCNMYSTNLRSLDGEFLCEDCRLEEEGY